MREEIVLAEGAVTIAGVSYSDTAFGAADAADVTLGCTNAGSHVTGVLKSGLSGENVTEVDLPKKDGDYRLTHSMGGIPDDGKLWGVSDTRTEIHGAAGRDCSVNASDEERPLGLNLQGCYDFLQGETWSVGLNLRFAAPLTGTATPALPDSADASSTTGRISG